MVSSFGNLATTTKEIIQTTKEKGMGICTGMTGLFTKEIGKKVYRMERVFFTWLMVELKKASLARIASWKEKKSHYQLFRFPKLALKITEKNYFHLAIKAKDFPNISLVTIF